MGRQWQNSAAAEAARPQLKEIRAFSCRLPRFLQSPLERGVYAVLRRSIVRVSLICRAGLALWLAGISNLWVGAGAEKSIAPPSFLGSLSCSSSSCHGSAATNKDQYLVWSRQDFHSRAFATLTTARSKRLAEVLRLADAAQSERCTTCHAPFQGVVGQQPKSVAKTIEGISCESCHGPAGDWIRTHTRTDLTHEQKVAAGLRDLKNVYVRANSCVACHQNLDPEFRQAGHPELIFELDGQCVTQPRHWRDVNPLLGPALWLTGQAAALREMSWQLTQLQEADPVLIDRWQALLWLVRKTTAMDATFPSFEKILFDPISANFTAAQQLSDKLASHSAAYSWSASLVRKILAELAGAKKEFMDATIAPSLHARRAERLVLALDRLTLALPLDASTPETREELDKLFKAVQSLPNFDPARFADRLARFQLTLRL